LRRVLVIASRRVRANARPDDKLREAIQGYKGGLDCFVADAPRNELTTMHGMTSYTSTMSDRYRLTGITPAAS
jgi:hypothetical protein